jgi:hypothetical protein
MADQKQATTEDVLIMVDPNWQATEDEETPPIHAVLGGWQLDAQGNADRFEGNPAYEPTDPGSPTDPVDAVVRLVLRREAGADRLLTVLDDVKLAIAVLDDKRTVAIADSPDDVPCVLVATAPAQRSHVEAPGWIEQITVRDLAGFLPDDGVDVLLNAGAPYSMRVATKTIKKFVAQLEPEEYAQEPDAPDRPIGK